MGSDTITAFFTCFSYIVQLQTKNQTLGAHKNNFKISFVFKNRDAGVTCRRKHRPKAID